MEIEFEHGKKILRYVSGAIHDCIKAGYMKGEGGYQITEKGLAGFDQLKASGFKPTDVEIDLAVLTLHGSDADIGISVLVAQYRDGLLNV